MWKLHNTGSWDLSVSYYTFAHLSNMTNNTKKKNNVTVTISLTHAGNDTMDWQAGQTMVDGLVHTPGISPCDSPGWLPLSSDKSWILLFGDVYIKAYVRCTHDVAGTRVQQDVGGVKPAHSDQTYTVPATTETSWGLHNARFWVLSYLGFLYYSILFVSVEGGKRKTFALVLSKEFTLLQADVMHLISRATTVGAVPLVCWTCTPLSVIDKEIWSPI